MIKLQGVYVFQFALLVTAAKWIFFFTQTKLESFAAFLGWIWFNLTKKKWAWVSERKSTRFIKICDGPTNVFESGRLSARA